MEEGSVAGDTLIPRAPLEGWGTHPEERRTLMTAGDPQKGLGAHGYVLPLLGRPEVSHEKTRAEQVLEKSPLQLSHILAKARQP